MHDESTSGIERAVFGAFGRDEIDAWLGRHLRDRLGAGLSRVLFRAGRVSAAYGVLLDDGREVAVKVHRRPVDSGRLAYLAAAAACQRRLAAYRCPRPVDGPATTDGVTAVVETLLAEGEAGDARDPVIRRALARSLRTQVDLLRGFPVDDLLVGAPAWRHYEQGPWPEPHDAIFDFTATPTGFRWLDDLARRAADVCNRSAHVDTIAHVDWVCGNARFGGGQLTAGYDWDSLAAGSEAVLVGFSAGAFTEGSTAGDETPTPAEVTAFLRDYEDSRPRPFTAAEQQAAAAAATWVLAYNARCVVSFLPRGESPSPGSPLHALDRHREAYLHLRW